LFSKSFVFFISYIHRAQVPQPQVCLGLGSFDCRYQVCCLSCSSCGLVISLSSIATEGPVRSSLSEYLSNINGCSNPILAFHIRGGSCYILLYCDNVFPWIDDPVMLNVHMGWKSFFGYTFITNKTFHFFLAFKIFTHCIVFCISFSSFKLRLQKRGVSILFYI
jgi:hypothetical protein